MGHPTELWQHFGTSMVHLLSLHTLRMTNSHDDNIKYLPCDTLVWQSMIRCVDLHTFEIVGSQFPAPAWGTSADDQPPSSIFLPEPHNTPTISNVDLE
jgi:hypothetical protein